MINTLIVEKTFGGSLRPEHTRLPVFNAHNEEGAPPRTARAASRLSVGRRLRAALLLLSASPFPRCAYPKVNTTGDFASHFPGKR